MIQLAVIVAFTVFFLNACTWKGMIFSFVKKNRLPECIQKPLYDCPICMAIWWGYPITIVYYLFEPRPITNWFVLFMCYCMAGGINAAILSVNKKKKCNCDRRNRLNLTDDEQ